jgi:glycosyltransferase involved in cell wall biosynthesis
MPALDEEENIEGALASATRMGEGVFARHEIVVVDDGSRDRTAAIVATAAERDPRIRLVTHPSNLGYGAAFRSGIRAASMDLVLFTDADNQFDLMEVERLLEGLSRAEVAIGYRLKRSEGLHRRFSLVAWRSVVRVALGISFRDIDCAFKLFPRSIVLAMPLTSSGATVSAELLARLQSAGVRIEEVGVHHYPRVAGRATGMRPGVILRAFKELAAVRRLLRREGHAGLRRPVRPERWPPRIDSRSN